MTKTQMQQVFELWDFAPNWLVEEDYEEVRLENAELVGPKGDQQLVVDFEVIQ